MKKILVVEDESIIAMELEAHLKAMGYEVVGKASSGVEAIAKARELQPDLILMDIVMPGEKNGIDAATEISSELDVPVIFLTAYADEDLIERAKIVEPFGYIVKPYEDKELRAGIEVALYKKEMERQLQKANEQLKQEIREHIRAEERIEHLNSVLKAIMNVGQLIMVEKDQDKLLQKACNALIDARDYDAAWLGLLRDGETFTTLKGSCLMEDVARFCEHVKTGDFPPCIKKALAQKDSLIVMDKTINCGDCVFKGTCAGKKTVLIRVEHANRLFGLLAISIEAEVTVSDKEKELLTAVAGDIAFALLNMELEEERKRAEEQLKHLTLSLQEHVEKLEDSKKKIIRAYSVKEHFLKETSHRIITPVTVIGGYTELLLESANLDDEQKEMIMCIRERNKEVQELTWDALRGTYLEEEEE